MANLVDGWRNAYALIRAGIEILLFGDVIPDGSPSSPNFYLWMITSTGSMGNKINREDSYESPLFVLGQAGQKRNLFLVADYSLEPAYF